MATTAEAGATSARMVSAACWVAMSRVTVKSSGTSLSKDAYLKLAKPSESEPVQRYASVAPDLYDRILNRRVDGQACLADTMASNRNVKRYDPSAEICTASNTVDVMPTFAPDAVINDGRRLLR